MYCRRKYFKNRIRPLPTLHMYDFAPILLNWSLEWFRTWIRTFWPNFFFGGGGRSATPCDCPPPPWPSIFSIILFLSITLLIGKTCISWQMQWPLTSQSHGSGKTILEITTFTPVVIHLDLTANLPSYICVYIDQFSEFISDVILRQHLIKCL
jgi:hypothetical protein